MKKLMFLSVFLSLSASVLAHPLVYDFKASVKHTYLKAKNNVREIFGVQLPSTQIYIKYIKTSSLQGYLIQDVDGVLGQTYGPGYVSRLDIGAKMPVMGGAHKYLSSGHFSTDCAVSKFTHGGGDVTAFV